VASLQVRPRPTPGEHDGIAKLARLNENGLDVEFFHIFTFT
jgi:hypothetical protein